MHLRDSCTAGHQARDKGMAALDAIMLNSALHTGIRALRTGVHPKLLPQALL